MNPHTFIEILRSRVPETFFERFYYEGGFYKLWIISPWLSPLQSSKISLGEIFTKISDEKIRTHIITRSPVHPWHEEAIRIAGRLENTEIVLNNNLHAKVYVAQGKLRSFGLLGSANLTAHGNTGIEVGVMIRNFRDGTQLINELVNTAYYIRASAGRKRIKEIGKKLDTKELSNAKESSYNV